MNLAHFHPRCSPFARTVVVPLTGLQTALQVWPAVRNLYTVQRSAFGTLSATTHMLMVANMSSKTANENRVGAAPCSTSIASS